jgi:hypothetical protein
MLIIKNYIKKKTNLHSIIELKLFIFSFPGYLIRIFPSFLKKKIILLITKFLEGKTRSYIEFSYLPKETKFFKRVNFGKFSDEKIAIIIQGPFIKRNDLTNRVIEQFKKITGPNVKILLSTWSDDLLTNDSKRCIVPVDIIIKNKKPDFSGPNNINLQIISTSSGINYFKKNDIDYIFKARTDQIYYSENILEFLQSLIKSFPVKKKILNKTNIKNRIVTCQPKSAEFYSLNDQFMFGSFDDLKNFWSSQSLVKKENISEINNIDNKIINKFGTEAYLFIKFLKRINYKCSYKKNSYIKSIKDLFCLVDISMLNRYWTKYPYEKNFETIFNKFEENPKQFFFLNSKFS